MEPLDHHLEALATLPNETPSLSTTLLDGDELLMLEESFRTNQRRRQSNESVATMMSLMTLDDDDDRITMDLEEMERMLTLEGELEPEPLSSEEDELIASASSALLAASPAGPSPRERLRSSWAGHHSFPSPAATASPVAIVSNPSRAAGHRASSHELLLSSAASRQWQAIASSPVPAPTKTRNPPSSRESSHNKESSIARSPAGMSSGSGAGATTPQLPAQLSQEDVLLRRLAASMQRSGETRSRLFLHSSTTTNTSPSIPSNVGHLEPGGRIGQKMTSVKEPLAPVLPAMMLDGQGCMTTMGGKKSQEQGAALPQKCLSATDATTTTTTTNRVAPTQSILRLSGFLSGDLKTLTSGLKHSRNMVQRHGSLLMRTSGCVGHVGNMAGVGGTTSI